MSDIKNEEYMEQSARLNSSITKNLFSIGDKIAKRENYHNISGLEAVHYYLIQKHNWLPSQVKSMSLEDLSFCLSDES